MGNQGTHVVRRVFLRATVAVFAAIALVVPAAQAQTTDPEDLGAIILPGVLTGFRKAPPPSLNGPLDAQALSDLTDGEASPEDFRGISSYAKTWINKHDDAVLIFLYRLENTLAAGDFYTDSATGSIEDGSRTATLRELPRAYSYVDTDGNFGVVQQRGRYVSVVHFHPKRAVYAIADAIELARLQAARFPDETPKTQAVSTDEGGSELGAKVISVAIFALLLWALILVQRRRRRKEAEQQTWVRDEEWMRITRRRGAVAVTMLAIAGAVTLAASVSTLAQAGLARRIQAGDSVSVEEVTANDDRQEMFVGLEGIVLVVTGIAWLMWQHRAHANLERFRSRLEMRFTPRWAVGWWFVPLANLVRPYQTMSELAELSAPPRGLRGRMALATKIAAWWCLFAASAIISRILVGTRNESVESVINESYLGAIAGSMRVASAVLAIMIVTRIQRDQEEVLASVLTPDARPESPALRPPPPPLPAGIQALVATPDVTAGPSEPR